jgi:signal transduction histidine kinase
VKIAFRSHLWRRMLAANLVLNTVLLASLTALFLWTYSRDVERQIAARAQALADALAGLSRFSMLVGDRAELEKIARNTVSFDEVLRVELTDQESGAPVTASRPGFERSRATWVEATQTVTRPDAADRIGWEAATRTPAQLGTVRILFSTARQRAARARVIGITAGMALACLLFGAAMQTLQLRALLRPLYTLTDFTGRVAEGWLDRRVKVERMDEIGRLAMAFNNMVERLGVTLVSKQEAEAANAAKGRFLATMSHELRTPLNAVIGYSQLLQEICQDRGIEGLTPDLERIERSGAILLQLVNQVLDYSKAEAEQIQLQPEPFDVRSVVEDVVSSVGPQVVKRNNRLKVSGETGPFPVSTDLLRFRQSLLNLVANACKFTEGGDISVELRREPSQWGDWVAVSIRDTGIGISADQQDRIFQAFTQADATTTRKFGGTGLGLSISRKFCRLMGGDITVESELGKGANFTMRLPAQLPRPQEEEGHAANEAIAGGG